ncbi:MAG: hypothetical protein RR536_05040 [Anaerovoracaceae bacterium]
MLTYGIKFCGGCNPRYDRKKAYNNLLAQNPLSNFILAHENIHCDDLIVICGCTNCCANIDDIIVKKQVHKIFSEEQIDELIKTIKVKD